MKQNETKQRIEAILYNNCATMSEKIEQIAELVIEQSNCNNKV